MKNTQLTVKERKKSLEANTSTVTGKANKVVHSSNFSIKPLIKFFNKTFKKENIVDSGNISSSVGQSEITETNLISEKTCEETIIEEIWEGTAEQGGDISDSSSNCSESSFGDISFSSYTDGDIFDSDMKDLELENSHLYSETRAPTVVSEEEFEDDDGEHLIEISDCEIESKALNDKNLQNATVSDLDAGIVTGAVPMHEESNNEPVCVRKDIRITPDEEPLQVHVIITGSSTHLHLLTEETQHAHVEETADDANLNNIHNQNNDLSSQVQTSIDTENELKICKKMKFQGEEENMTKVDCNEENATAIHCTDLNDPENMSRNDLVTRNSHKQSSEADEEPHLRSVLEGVTYPSLSEGKDSETNERILQVQEIENVLEISQEHISQFKDHSSKNTGKIEILGIESDKEASDEETVNETACQRKTNDASSETLMTFSNENSSVITEEPSLITKLVVETWETSEEPSLTAFNKSDQFSLSLLHEDENYKIKKIPNNGTSSRTTETNKSTRDRPEHEQSESNVNNDNTESAEFADRRPVDKEFESNEVVTQDNNTRMITDVDIMETLHYSESKNNQDKSNNDPVIKSSEEETGAIHEELLNEMITDSLDTYIVFYADNTSDCKSVMKVEKYGTLDEEIDSGKKENSEAILSNGQKLPNKNLINDLEVSNENNETSRHNQSSSVAIEQQTDCGPYDTNPCVTTFCEITDNESNMTQNYETLSLSMNQIEVLTQASIGNLKTHNKSPVKSARDSIAQACSLPEVYEEAPGITGNENCQSIAEQTEEFNRMDPGNIKLTHNIADYEATPDLDMFEDGIMYRTDWHISSPGGRTAHEKAWSECNSVCSTPSSWMERSFHSEGNHKRRFSQRRRSLQMTRRASVTEFDRKPWNYGAGGSQYQKLLYPFGKKKRNSVV